MPVRGSRRLYLVDQIQVNLDDNPDGTDEAPAQTEGGSKRPIIAKIKEPIGNYFGLTPLDFDDAIFDGVFNGKEGSGNRGSKFRRRLGGFKVASYKFIAKTEFEITELVVNPDGAYGEVTAFFKSVSIGLPKGHSVNEVIEWAKTFSNLENVRTLVTPKGHGIDLFKAG